MNYLCVDFGGTKTLVCIIDDQKNITTEVRFETPEHYPDFVERLSQEIRNLPEKFTSGVMSVPGLIDQTTGTILALGNRAWQNFPLHADLQERTGVNMHLLNDARLGALAEGVALKDQFSKVLFITVSTGIGGGLCVNGTLDHSLDDTEFGKMPLMYEGTYQPWEEFASGRAIVATYNQRASDITDPTIWQEVAGKLAVGLGPLIAVLQPEAIVFGGGAGQQADKFKDFLRDAVEPRLHPVIRKPKAYLATQIKDVNVIHGCYYYAKELEQA
ncbi:MAG: ROK family protein [Candidatus Saccharimonadales bacterium]